MAIRLKRHAKTIFTHFNISVDAQKNAYYDQSTGYLKHRKFIQKPHNNLQLFNIC